MLQILAHDRENLIHLARCLKAPIAVSSDTISVMSLVFANIALENSGSRLSVVSLLVSTIFSPDSIAMTVAVERRAAQAL